MHRPPFRGLALAMNEPVGVIGIACPEEPGLLAFVSLMGAAIAAGNTVVMLPSEAQALIATDLYQVLDTSDVPGGVVNIVTGDKRALALELAKHDAVDALWYFGDRGGRRGAGEGLGRQPQADLVRDGQRATGTMPRSAAGASCWRTPAGQEHLDSLRGVGFQAAFLGGSSNAMGAAVLRGCRRGGCVRAGVGALAGGVRDGGDGGHGNQHRA